MEIRLEYNLDIAPDSRWRTVSATAASKASQLYAQEVGDFLCGPDYFTAREGFVSYLIKYTVSGCGMLEYQGRQYLVPPGHLFWIDCRKYQCYRTAQTVGSWHTVWVHFYGAQVAFYHDIFLKQTGGSPVAAMPAGSPVYKLIMTLLEQPTATGFQLKTDLIYADLLGQLVTGAPLSTMASPQDGDVPQTIQNVQIYLTQNYRQKITLEALGTQFNLNPYYLQKQFKRYIGQSPSEYLIYLRITRAKELIRTTTKNIGEIAHMVGMDNLGYFTRLFKSQEGMTPLEYSRLWPRQPE